MITDKAISAIAAIIKAKEITPETLTAFAALESEGWVRTGNQWELSSTL